jgi:GAF domain-containing protein/HAMP domain-containing protein
MNQSDRSSPLARLLLRTGGWFPILVLLLAQLGTSPLGLLLAAIPSQINADLTSLQTIRVVTLAGILLLIRNAILLVMIYASNRQLFNRLIMWKRGTIIESETEEEFAWKQATSFAWRYMTLAVASLFGFVLFPCLVYLRSALDATADQIIYVGLAATSAGLSLAVLELLIVENLMGPARQILLPQKFESQLSHVSSLNFLTKFLLIILILVAVGILLVGPVGYHQTVSALSGKFSSQTILNALQYQLILAGISALLLGLALAYLMTRSISSPIRQMINVLEKVEAGDLSLRLKIATTDEVGELSIYFNRMVSRLENFATTLESQVAFRTEQLRATLEVGRVATEILDPDEMISKVINLITDRFGYYYAAIFLIDITGQWAELKDATGTAGQTLKEQGHKLEILGKSMVGTAISTRQARIALDVGLESVRFGNPLLPDTKSEIALPLIVSERVIGALDVQSTQQSAFDEQGIETLQGMANQLAIALERARLFKETEESLAEVRAAQRLYVKSAWSELAQDNTVYEYSSNPEKHSGAAGSASMDIPLTLREQIIGQLHLEGQEDWTPEERGLVESVATQAALAMENARLFEASQQTAQRDRLVAEITGKVWSSPNADFILQTAIKELGQALRADEAIIELKMD